MKRNYKSGDLVSYAITNSRAQGAARAVVIISQVNGLLFNGQMVKVAGFHLASEIPLRNKPVSQIIGLLGED